MAGSRSNESELEPATDPGAGHPAAAVWCRTDSGERNPSPAEIRVQPRLRADSARGGAQPDVASRQRLFNRRRRRLPCGQLGGAIRYRAGGGSPGGADALTDGSAGGLLAVVCAEALGAGGGALPLPVPVSADGVERSFSDP